MKNSVQAIIFALAITTSLAMHMPRPAYSDQIVRSSSDQTIRGSSDQDADGSSDHFVSNANAMDSADLPSKHSLEANDSRILSRHQRSTNVQNCDSRYWRQNVSVSKSGCNAISRNKVKIIPANATETKRCFETQCSIPIPSMYRVVGRCYKDATPTVIHRCDGYEPSEIIDYQCQRDANCHPLKCPVPVRNLKRSHKPITYIPVTVACLRIEDVSHVRMGAPAHIPPTPSH